MTCVGAVEAEGPETVGPSPTMRKRSSLGSFVGCGELWLPSWAPSLAGCLLAPELEEGAPHIGVSWTSTLTANGSPEKRPRMDMRKPWL